MDEGFVALWKGGTKEEGNFFPQLLFILRGLIILRGRDRDHPLLFLLQTTQGKSFPPPSLFGPNLPPPPWIGSWAEPGLWANDMGGR